MDTQLTADGHLVVMHDDSVDRDLQLHGHGHLEDVGAAWPPCDAREPFPGWPTFEPVPALRDVSSRAGGRLAVDGRDQGHPPEANFDPSAPRSPTRSSRS